MQEVLRLDQLLASGSSFVERLSRRLDLRPHGDEAVDQTWIPRVADLHLGSSEPLGIGGTFVEVSRQVW